MKKSNVSTAVTLWINRAVGALMGVLLFTLPMLLDWYAKYRFLTARGSVALTVAFYSCAVFVFIALWFMDGLLRSILRGEVFVRQNVIRIRRIRFCCGIVGLICLPAALFYAPLIFLAVIMGFLCLAVSVVASVMDAAVAIREENDLTV
jgi:hypothetical protein